MGASQTQLWGLWTRKILFYPSLETLLLDSHPPFQNTQNTKHNATCSRECFEKIHHPYPANKADISVRLVAQVHTRELPMFTL